MRNFKLGEDKKIRLFRKDSMVKTKGLGSFETIWNHKWAEVLPLNSLSLWVFDGKLLAATSLEHNKQYNNNAKDHRWRVINARIPICTRGSPASDQSHLAVSDVNASLWSDWLVLPWKETCFLKYALLSERGWTTWSFYRRELNINCRTG